MRPAAKAGLQRGTKLLQMDGETIAEVAKERRDAREEGDDARVAAGDLVLRPDGFVELRRPRVSSSSNVGNHP